MLLKYTHRFSSVTTYLRYQFEFTIFDLCLIVGLKFCKLC